MGTEARTTELLDIGSRGKIVNVTGAAAVAYTLKPATPFRLRELRIHLSAAGGAGNLTATMDAGEGAAYDLVVLTQDMTAVVDLIWTPTNPLQFEAADEIDFAWANAQTKTYGMTIVYDLL
jgi:hypothetical protein